MNISLVSHCGLWSVLSTWARIQLRVEAWIRRRGLGWIKSVRSGGNDGWDEMHDPVNGCTVSATVKQSCSDNITGQQFLAHSDPRLIKQDFINWKICMLIIGLFVFKAKSRVPLFWCPINFLLGITKSMFTLSKTLRLASCVFAALHAFL